MAEDETRTRAELRAEKAKIQRASSRMNIALWAIAAGVMIYGAGNVTELMLAHRAPWPTAPLLSLMVDLGLCVALWGDRALQLYNRKAGWLVVLRWATAAMTWALNVAGSALRHDWVGVGIWSCGPVLLVIVAEAAAAIQRQVTAIVADLDAEEKTARAKPHPEPKPAPVVKVAPAASSRTPRDEIVARIAADMRHPGWAPDYPALMAETGFSRSWCEKVVRDARMQAPARLEAVR